MIEVKMYFPDMDLTLTNDDIQSESLELEHFLMSGNKLVYGKCNSAICAFTTFKTDTKFKDKPFILSVKKDGTTINLGIFFVKSEKLSTNRTSKSIEAYDKLNKIYGKDARKWYKNLFGSGKTVTLKTLRDSLFSKFNIRQRTVSLPLDSITIKKFDGTIKSLSYNDVLEWICEINGCFGYMDIDGQFRYVFLNDRTLTHKFSPSDYYDSNFEDFTVRRINKIEVNDYENKITSIYENSTGDDDNEYVVKDNLLLYKAEQETMDSVKTTLVAKITSVFYIPFNLRTEGKINVHLGDLVEVTNLKGETYTSYVLNKKLSGIVGMKSEFSANGEEYYADAIQTVAEKVKEDNATSNNTSQIEDNVSELSSTVQGLSDNMLKCKSVAALPSNTEPNTIYLIQGTVG